MAWLDRLLRRRKSLPPGPSSPDHAPGPSTAQPLAPEPTPQDGGPEPSPTLGGDHFRFQTPACEPAPEDEAEGEGEEEVDWTLDEPDPTIGRYAPLEASSLDPGDLEAMRAQSYAQALSGSHRIQLWDLAGPGSVAEALARLEHEGRVASRIVEDPQDGPYILYEPLDRASAPL